VGGRLASTQFQFTLQDADANELNDWAPRILARLRGLPQLRDVATDQQLGGTALTIDIDRDAAGRYGITPQLINDTLYDAFGQRQVAQYFTQVNYYHVVLEGLPEILARPTVLQNIFIRCPLTGEQVPFSSFAYWNTAPTKPLAINHQSMFPSATISFNLAPGAPLGDAVLAIQQAQRDMVAPGSLISSFQGNAQAFQASLVSVPLLVIAALVVVYIVLGILYESFIHPLTILSTLPSAGFGALVTLWAFGYDFSVAPARKSANRSDTQWWVGWPSVRCSRCTPRRWSTFISRAFNAASFGVWSMTRNCRHCRRRFSARRQRCAAVQGVVNAPGSSTKIETSTVLPSAASFQRSTTCSWSVWGVR
jgi:HAE1 family hydrophobic/amphiphilic exporter-1